MANSIKQVTNVNGSTMNLGDIELAAIRGVEQGTNVFSGGNNFGAKLLAAGTGHTLTAADSGKTIIFNAAAATTVKLPAPAIGMVFNFVTAVTATADHVIQAETDDHGFIGGCVYTNTTADQTNAFAADTDGSNDFITMNGTTTGGHAGSTWRIVGILAASAAACWVATGQLIGSGNTITPFGDSQI